MAHILKQRVKKLLFIPPVFVIVVVIWFAALGYMSKSGMAAGLVNGKLTQCPNKPNCVSSQYENDAAHYVAPVSLPQSIVGNTTEIQKILKLTLQEVGGSVHAGNDTYLTATFSSSLFGFIDDVETLINHQHNVIHIRSASRVGHGDMGVNKERVVLITQIFAKNAQQFEPAFNY